MRRQRTLPSRPTAMSSSLSSSRLPRRLVAGCRSSRGPRRARSTSLRKLAAKSRRLPASACRPTSQGQSRRTRRHRLRRREPLHQVSLSAMSCARPLLTRSLLNRRWDDPRPTSSAHVDVGELARDAQTRAEPVRFARELVRLGLEQRTSRDRLGTGRRHDRSAERARRGAGCRPDDVPPPSASPRSSLHRRRIASLSHPHRQARLRPLGQAGCAPSQRL